MRDRVLRMKYYLLNFKGKKYIFSADAVNSKPS